MAIRKGNVFHARSQGRRVSNSRAMEVLSRVGLSGRGVIYVLVGLLAVQMVSAATEARRPTGPAR